MVEPQFADVGQKLEMDILDKKYNITVIEDSPYDPRNEKLKQQYEVTRYRKKSHRLQCSNQG